MLTPILIMALLLGGCLGTPDGVEPVKGFELERYLGTWYEIARLDHRFERGLSSVNATYSMREDGSVRVINRGYSEEKGQWSEAEGVAKFVADTGTAHLKVSFFGPFYGAYVVFDLDKADYSHALVCGSNREYFWVLSRSPHMERETLDALLAKARALGFDTDKLILVEQEP